MGKVARSAERGAAKNSRMPRVIPPQLRLRSAERWLEYGRLAALPLAILPIPPDSPLAASPTGRARLESPVSRWRLLVQYKLGVQCRTPSRSDRFNGVRGVQGGLRGEIEIFPGPPAKKVIRKLLSLLFISTPQSRLTPCQLPGRGAFGCALQPLVQSRRAANDGPYSASYKLSAIIKGRPPVPLLLYSLSAYSASSLLGSAFRLSSLGADSSSA